MPPIFLMLGLVVGVVSGMIGIGGGVLLIPLLMWLPLDIDQPRAAGITLAVLSVPVALPAVSAYYRNGTVTPNELWIALWLAIGFAAGGWLGAQLRPLIALESLRLLFGLVLLFVALRFLITMDSEVACALIGICTVAAAWISFWVLKRLGRTHLSAPVLADKIRAARHGEPAEGDYYI